MSVERLCIECGRRPARSALALTCSQECAASRARARALARSHRPEVRARNAALTRLRRAHGDPRRVTRVEYRCDWCRATYLGIRREAGLHGRYCGRECYQQARRERRRAAGVDARLERNTASADGLALAVLALGAGETQESAAAERYTAACAECGTEFRARTPQRIYCSARCRRRVGRRRARGE